MSFFFFFRRYTGSKYKISNWIKSIVLKECPGCTSFCDLFAGTGVITNSLIPEYSTIIINDFLFSNEIIYKAFFEKSDYNSSQLLKFYQQYNSLDPTSIEDNFVSKNYGNKYFEYSDSKLIGYIRQDIFNNKSKIKEREYSILLASLLYSLDKCANTVGHYEAYRKKSILKSRFRFELISPVINGTMDKRNIIIKREDANKLAKTLHCDLVYIDPPYSSRQYSRFYHILETITKWDNPKLYGEALKPIPENMSSYCSSKAIVSFGQLINDLNCKFIVVSYNNTYNSRSNSSKNKMSINDILNVLKKRGETKTFSIDHNAFNAGKTDLANHKEFLFVTKVGA